MAKAAMTWCAVCLEIHATDLFFGGIPVFACPRIGERMFIVAPPARPPVLRWSRRQDPGTWDEPFR